MMFGQHSIESQPRVRSFVELGPARRMQLLELGANNCAVTLPRHSFEQ
jgi:hypothetical protein